MAGGIKLNLKGFDKKLEALQKAGGNVDRATETAINRCVPVVERELKAAAESAGVPNSVTSEIVAEPAKWAGNRCSARVGWRIGSYDPKNLSAGFKAIFLNYGTPRKREVKTEKVHVQVRGEWRTLGKDRGSLPRLDFIGAAKKSSRSKVRKIQQETIDEIMEDLNR